MKRLTEFGVVMFILGLNMILLPSMFENDHKFHYTESESFFSGLVFFIIGTVIIIWRTIIWLKEPEK